MSLRRPVLLSTFLRWNPDPVAGLIATIEAIQSNWNDVVSRASLTGQLMAGVKKARRAVALSGDKKTLRSIIKVASELLNKLRGRDGTMVRKLTNRKNLRHPMRKNSSSSDKPPLPPLSEWDRDKGRTDQWQGYGINLPDTGKRLTISAHQWHVGRRKHIGWTASVGFDDICREKSTPQEAYLAVKDWYNQKKNPRKRRLKRNGSGRVTHNGHVITIKDSVYTVQPYKKAFSGPDGLVRAKKWIDAHVLRESGQGWKLKANPRHRVSVRRIRRNPTSLPPLTRWEKRDGKYHHVLSDGRNIWIWNWSSVGGKNWVGWIAIPGKSEFAVVDKSGLIQESTAGLSRSIQLYSFPSASAVRSLLVKWLAKYKANPRRRKPVRRNPAMKYDAAKNKYKFFVVQHQHIAGGFEHREDALDLVRELKARNQVSRVLTRAGVVRLGIDPKVNANWHRTNPRRRRV